MRGTRVDAFRVTRLPEYVLTDDGSALISDGRSRIGALAVDTTLTALGTGTRVDWSVTNTSNRVLRIDRVGLRVPTTPVRVLEHGWQSWSPIRWCSPDDIRPERLRTPRWRRAMYHADAAGAGRIVAGDQFLLDDGGMTGFLGGDRHLGTATATTDGVVAWALLDGIALGPGEVRELHPLWLASGDPDDVYVEYVTHWAMVGGARSTLTPPLGWCSWYRYSSGVTPDDVVGQLGAAAEHGVEVVQIDDGWQRSVGEWRSFATQWEDLLAPVAAKIRAAGLRPGIWTAPFLVAARSAIVVDHPEWLLHDHGTPVKAMHHPTLWGGWTFALDATHPGVQAHLEETFDWLRTIGFEVYKLDFLYAGALPGPRHDGTKTRAEALRAGLATIRTAVGDDAFLLGCGCPLGPAVGIADAMRVSPDVTPRWSPTWHVTGYEEAAPCAGNSVRNSRFRAALHGRLWANDADCLLVRNPYEARSQSERDECDEVVASTGFVTLSDDLRDYDGDDWARVRMIRAGGAVMPSAAHA